MNAINAIHVAAHPTRKLGLVLPDRTRPRQLPKFGALKAKFGIAVPPPAPFDYTAGLPADLGALGNDQLGLCAYAAPYHRMQMIVFLLTGQFISGDLLKNLAIRFYEEAGRFDPNAALVRDPGTGEMVNPTDQGGFPDDISRFLLTHGLMQLDGTRDVFLGAFDVDVANLADLVFCARECAGIEFGVMMTDEVMPPDGSEPPLIWREGGNQIGAHAIQNGAWNGQNWRVNSWGKWYYPTNEFIRQNGVTATCYVSRDALKNGKTVLGLTLEQWQGELRGHAQAVSEAA